MGKRTKDRNIKQNARKKLSIRSNKSFSSKKFSGIDKNSKASTNPNRIIPNEKLKNFYRTPAKIKLLNLYNSKPSKDRFKRPETPARIAPDRKWFGNTRTITQKKLEEIRKEISLNEKNKKNPHNVFLNKTKLPENLLKPILNEGKIKNKLTSFEDTFGKKSRRTIPNLSCYTIEELADRSIKQTENYQLKNDSNLNHLNEIEKDAPEMKYMKAGQSKRIYGELLKVIDASDVLCEVLDSRDPFGTRCRYIESYISKNCPHKHIVYILNKCDLVPTWVTASYIKSLSKDYPTIAFHASITNPFGKPALFSLLRQFDAFHRDKKNISVGFIGYPNVGKSSVINTLKKQKSCKTAPIPGETKVWQYVSLTKRIYLIDCPGVVYEEGSQNDRVLRSVVRAEKIEEPIEFVNGILERADPNVLKRIYKIGSWKDTEDFVTQCARNYGKLIKGGEPDLKATAKILLMDWQRGKIPYFVEPPKDESKNEINNINDETKEIKAVNIQENEDMNQKYGIKQNVEEINVNLNIGNEDEENMEEEKI